MKIIEQPYECDEFKSKVLDAYLGDFNYAVFDIETTGLNPKYTKIILAGFFFKDKETGTFMSRQILAENQSEEKELLLELKKQLELFDYVVTFNGKHFDLAYIIERYRKYKILFRPPLYNLDIYLVLNGFSPLRKSLPNLKQKTVEKYAGIADGREDQISGRESVILYNEYEATKDPVLEKVIALHNSDDVCQLYKLQKVLLKADIHKAFTKMGFPVKTPTFGNLQVNEIKLLSKEIAVSGIQYAPEATDYIKFSDMDNAVSVSMDSTTREFEVSIPIERKYGGAYVNLENVGIEKETLAHLGGYVNGFLVVENMNMVSNIDLNYLIMAVLKSL